MDGRDRKKPRATVARSKSKRAGIVKSERDFVKWRDADRKKRGFAPNTAPDDFSIDDAVEARIAPYVAEARAAFGAATAAAAAISAFVAEIKPFLAEIRHELGLHRGRLVSLENEQSKHAVRLDNHHERLTALEQRTAKGQ